MPRVFLISTLLGLAFALNALRPLPGTVLSLPSFFAGWLTTELAPQILVVHVAAVTAFALNGALDGPLGWAGLGVAALTAAILVMLVVQSQRVRDRIEGALCAGLGEDYRERILPERRQRYDLSVPWRQLLLPFWMRHPDVERVRNLPYGPRRRRNLLDVYRHKDRPTGCPVLLQVHGGGWTIGNKDQQGRPLMLHLASRGWVCVAVNYPLSPRARWPDHIVDLKRALAWVRDHAAEYGGDPGFVVVTGGSAGGHLAALMALSQNDPSFQPGFEDADTSVQACVPFYGVYDFTNELGSRMGAERRKFLERAVFKRRFEDDREAFVAASPLSRVSPEAPPFLVVHGAHDSLVPVEEARQFVGRLAEVSDNPVCYAELPGAQHAFEVFPSIRTAHVVKAVERFCDHAWCEWLARRAARREGA